MADNLPNSVIGRDILSGILSFVDRSTWFNFIVANREFYQESRNLKAKAP
jgi:hypothetical protein